MEGQYVTIHGLNITHSPPAAPAMSIGNLFPALLECFGIILCGYVAGRCDIIGAGEVKGLGSFVSCFALPALLFKNMVQLRFEHVVWSFLWSILMAKVCVFTLVCVLTLLVASPESKFSKAGLFAIFATQSNDFALGHPIVDALYRSSHPEYVQYIYLVAPVSLMLLNPVGFALCEIQRWRQTTDGNYSKLRVMCTVTLQILKNPIVFMVIVGILFHFLFGGRVPVLLAEFVDGLANSFGGAALFYLGLNMVGQMRRLTRSAGVSLILLITAKLLVMPLMCKDMVELLDAGNSSLVNHSSLSDYAFLYGVFPTAPSVAIYAAHYNMELEVVMSGLVISTFLSAPIMYVSAWLLTIPWMEATSLVKELQDVSFNISVVSLIALVWTLAVMLLSKKFRRPPHMFTTNLFFAQFLACLLMIMWSIAVRQGSEAGQILIFTLLYGCLYSTYMWTGLLAFSLTLLRRNENMKVKPWIFIMFGWGVPFLIVGGLLVVGQRMSDSRDSAFFYGSGQMMCTVLLLGCSIMLAGLSLMGLSRGVREEQNYHVLSQNTVTSTTDNGRHEDSPERELSHSSLNRDVCSSEPMPDMIAGHLSESPGPSAGYVQYLFSHIFYVLLRMAACGFTCVYVGVLGAPLSEASSSTRVQEERQIARHVLLCLLLIVCMLANVSSCLWWLFSDNPGRLYLELQFFCAVANYGQGLISFGIFGLDEHLILLPFKKRLAALCGLGPDENPESSAVQEDIRLTRTQFVRYHKDQCVQDIVRNKGGSSESLTGPAGESFL
ncbi:integral membrane protein GPR155 isoform X1 [Triplophysa dalaica]|uniref:integral membrane protein GPR155 isoform X1 n=1 Tax=Triplophysa dalaica TaxID=1582913 RepID=UPI0024DF8E1A|nr:integral membrane protein GPR155 isoform X1 [Triplophysa dalaica]XP_056607542.1 integral membrane protein GPR155 isoform X1 [Triplophysa dalaica]XP_056607543.1 integral membrane protein GPR155 isoform X1 [Triplophysa dalaica]